MKSLALLVAGVAGVAPGLTHGLPAHRTLSDKTPPPTTQPNLKCGLYYELRSSTGVTEGPFAFLSDAQSEQAKLFAIGNPGVSVTISTLLIGC